jgi:hypothetical protein
MGVDRSIGFGFWILAEQIQSRGELESLLMRPVNYLVKNN